MPRSILPSDYPALLAQITRRIQYARTRALLAVNQELLMLYWHIGHDLLVRRTQDPAWGAGVTKQLATDLRQAFPDMTGLSPRNLQHMAAFASAYSEEAFPTLPVCRIPWGHNILLLLMAVDDLLANPTNLPSVGLILCTQRSATVAEYALRASSAPMGVATYKVQDSLPEPLRTALPPIEDTTSEVTKMAQDSEANLSLHPLRAVSADPA